MALLCFLLLLSPLFSSQIGRAEVMQQGKTERAFSGKYLYETKDGTYCCANCDNPLFSSEDKYDSGAGWPSFTQTISQESVYYLADNALPFKRYRVLCRKCNSHLGHVFNDGPEPKGLRYCINSIALALREE